MKPSKLASCLLALVASASVAEANRNVPAAPIATANGGLPIEIRRPIHVAPEVIGMTVAALVDRVRHATSAKDIAAIADKLGAIGNDDVVDALAPMLADTRTGVPEAILDVFAHIDTEHAVEQILAHVRDPRVLVRTAAIGALGTTLSAKAETALLEMSKQTTDRDQLAIVLAALAALGSDRATARLVELAHGKEAEVAQLAATQLGSVGLPAAQTALRELVESKDAQLAATALAQLDTIDDALLAELGAIVRAKKEPMKVRTALAALGQAGDRALPILREAALHGGDEIATIAMSSIVSIGSPKALAILGEVLVSSDHDAVRTAAALLGNVGTPDARKLLLAAARAETGDHTEILSSLVDVTGDDVDALLRDVAKHGTSERQRVVLPRLLKANDATAFAIATALATKGPRDERFEAMRLLLDSPKGSAIVIDIARKERGQARMTVLSILATQHPVAPAVVRMLVQGLTSGAEEEAAYAANELGQIDAPEARQALIDALADTNPDIAGMAASALVDAKMSDATKSALITAAHANSRVLMSVIFPLIQAKLPEGMQLAKDAIDGTDENAATQSISAISQVDTPEARQLLEHALASSNWTVKQVAIFSLGEQGTWGLEHLVQLARSDDGPTVTVALQTLAQVGSERAEAAILEAGKSPKADTRIAAIGAIPLVDDARTNALLAELVRDSDPHVAGAAIRSVRSGGPEIVGALGDVVDDKRADAALRTAAARQLRQLRAKLGPTTDANVRALAPDAADDGG